MTELKAVGKKFPGTTNFRYKFYAAPVDLRRREGEQGVPRRPAHRDHALVGRRRRRDRPTKQQGVWQYCSEFSGEALDAFMKKYPYYDSPEPDAMSARTVAV